MIVKKYIYISIIILVIFIILWIYFKLSKKNYAPMPIAISNEVLENGTLTDAELKNLANSIKGNIDGLTIFGEAEMLQSVLNLSDIDLIRLYNIYLDKFSISLYKDIINEWYWNSNQDLVQSVKQKFINLHINN